MKASLTSMRTLLRAAFTTTSVKRVTIGMNDTPMEDNLPEIQVYPAQTSVILSGTVKDERQRIITIRLVDKVKSTLNQTASGQETMSSVLNVAELLEKTVADGSFATDSVMGVLRTTPRINDQALYTNEMTVEYRNLSALGFPNVAAEVNVTLVSRERRIS